MRLALVASLFDVFGEIDPRLITLLESKYIPIVVDAAGNLTVRIDACDAVLC